MALGNLSAGTSHEQIGTLAQVRSKRGMNFRSPEDVLSVQTTCSQNRDDGMCALVGHYPCR